MRNVHISSFANFLIFDIVAYEIPADVKDITEKTKLRFQGSAVFPDSDESLLHNVMRKICMSCLEQHLPK